MIDTPRIIDIVPLVFFAAIVAIITGVLFQRYQKPSDPKEFSVPTVALSSPTLPPVSAPSVKPVSPAVSLPQTHPEPSVAFSLKYPGSQETSPGVYVSSDSADAITEWYATQINQTGYNVKTFIKTNSNGKILNKLVAGGNFQNISVEITKNAGQSTTKITVVIDNN